MSFEKITPYCDDHVGKLPEEPIYPSPDSNNSRTARRRHGFNPITILAGLLFLIAVTCVYHSSSRRHVHSSPALPLAAVDSPLASATVESAQDSVATLAASSAVPASTNVPPAFLLDCVYVNGTKENVEKDMEQANSETQELKLKQHVNTELSKHDLSWKKIIGYLPSSFQDRVNENAKIVKEGSRLRQWQNDLQVRLDSLNSQSAACDAGDNDVNSDDSDALTNIVSAIKKAAPAMSPQQVEEMLSSCKTGVLPSESIVTFFKDAFIGGIPPKGFCKQFSVMVDTNGVAAESTVVAAFSSEECPSTTTTTTTTLYHTVTLPFPSETTTLTSTGIVTVTKTLRRVAATA